LEYYLRLDYDVRIKRVEDDGDFIYMATALELDEAAIYGVGTTKPDALQSFEGLKNEMFEYYYENNIPIPEPRRESVVQRSGKFMVRTSPATHNHLYELAQSNNQSLNALVNCIFERYTTAALLTDRFVEMAERANSEAALIVPRSFKDIYSAAQPGSKFSSKGAYDETNTEAA